MEFFCSSTQYRSWVLHGLWLKYWWQWRWGELQTRSLRVMKWTECCRRWIGSVEMREWYPCLALEITWCRISARRESPGYFQTWGSSPVLDLSERWLRWLRWRCLRGRTFWQAGNWSWDKHWLHSRVHFIRAWAIGRGSFCNWYLQFGPIGCWSWNRSSLRCCFRSAEECHCWRAGRIAWYRTVWGLFISRSSHRVRSKPASCWSDCPCLK